MVSQNHLLALLSDLKLRLKVKNFVSSLCLVCGLRLNGFYKVAKSKLHINIGLKEKSTWELVQPFVNKDSNMAAINFAPLENLKKKLKIKYT